jgi:uncharacterized phage protein (TIGR01671 family)
MREIKFREYRGDGRWHYWGLMDEGKFVGPCSPNSIAYQYTGLKDKNGKEIYEGDVFYHKPDPTKDDKVVCVVSFSQGAFGCKGEGISQYLCYANEKVEVIGNIHENPELLK